MEQTSATLNAPADEAPGESGDLRAGIAKCVGGFVLSVLLTLASFWAAGTTMVWQPGVPILLAALAIGQMGVHLVFFLHVSSGPEATNNILALAFGAFVVALVVFGSMVGYSSYIYVLDHLPIALVSIYTYMNPVVAMILGRMFFNEPLGLREYAALAVIFAGVGIVKWYSPRKPADALS